MSGNKSRTPRRPHTYFGFVPKQPGESLSVSSGRGQHEPALTAAEEPGVLWAEFRAP